MLKKARIQVEDVEEWRECRRIFPQTTMGSEIRTHCNNYHLNDFSNRNRSKVHR